MIGPILVFIGVCVIVAIYMAIVHSFLRASEEESRASGEKDAARAPDAERDAHAASSQPEVSRQPHWAH